MRRVLTLVPLALLLAGCASGPDNVAMPPADKREKQATVVIPPLGSSKAP